MRRIVKFLFFAVTFLSLAACNLPTSAKTPDAIGTLQAISTGQVATEQALETPTLVDLPTLSFPTLPSVGGTATPIPTSQSQGTATSIPVSYCNWAAYIKDLTIPDGTVLAPGAQFTKTWRLQNIGTCAWTTSYALVFSSGDSMGGTVAVDLPTTVYPDQTVDLSVNLSAPSSEGNHRSYWGLRSASGAIFGIGASANSAFYVDIKVVGSMTTVFDFAKYFCTADWRSDAGDLGCPGNEGGKKGYAIQVDDPKLEDGSNYNGIGLLTVPQKVTDGYLRGYYQEFLVKSGDHFRGIVNCEYLSTGCNVLFRLEYQINDGAIQTFWQFPEAYEGQYYTVDLDLSVLAGKKVKFILAVLANGSADADKPLWVSPRIDRPSNLITPTTPTPKPTKTPGPTQTATVTITVTPPVPTLTSTVPPTITETPTVTLTP